MATIIFTPQSEARYRGLRMSADEYLSLADDGHRYELVDGVICMSPSPSRLHQRIVAEIVRQLGNHLLRKPIGEVVVEVDVRLGEDLVYRPDVIFLSAEKAAACRDRVTVVPDVVVEVISADSRRYDRETKQQDYERCGVREYWLIDPDRREFAFYRLEGGRFVEAVAGERTFASGVVSGFELELDRVRDLFVSA